MKDHGLGALRSPVDPRDAEYHAVTLGLPTAPALPVQVALPPGGAWDQGSEGTCVGHGVGLAAVVAIHRATGEWIVRDAGAGHRLGRDLYYQTTHDATYSYGTWARLALRTALKVGVLGADGRRHKIGAYHSLLPSADIRSDIEAALAAGMVVNVSYAWSRRWMVANAPFDTLPRPALPDAGGHNVSIWRAAMKHPTAGSAALRRDHSLRNSWGSSWFGDGAAYVDAAIETTSRLWEAWVITAGG